MLMAELEPELDPEPIELFTAPQHCFLRPGSQISDRGSMIPDLSSQMKIRNFLHFQT
jgi:hypothetical protein